MTRPTDPSVHEQAMVAEQSPQALIQEVQSEIGRLQMRYRDSDPRFWALAVAWQAIRMAWYVVDNDPGTARDKLTLVEEAVADLKRLLR